MSIVVENESYLFISSTYKDNTISFFNSQPFPVGSKGSIERMILRRFVAEINLNTSRFDNPVIRKDCLMRIYRIWFCYCLLYTSPSPRDRQKSRMPSSA